MLGSQMTYNDAKACLDYSFPFPPDVRTKTVASIKAIINNSYVFQDLAAGPPSAPGLTFKNASIISDIDAFVASPATSKLTDRAFHEGLSDILTKARDAHLLYAADCFLAFAFNHGFIMGDMIDYSGNRVLLVVATLPNFATLSSLNFNAQGCNVVTINDKSAFDYIQAWADDNLSISKDAAVRYNAAVGGPVFDARAKGYTASGQFSWRARLPAESSLKFGFKCPNLWGSVVKQVVVQWGASFKGGIVTSDQYYDNYCSAKMNKESMPISEESHDQQQHRQQTPFEVPSDPIQERAITEVMQEFKAMPDWLAKRTLEIILGPNSAGDSKLEWTDEADQEILRTQAERVLREIPVFVPVPRLPIFEHPHVHKWDFSHFASAADPYQVLLISPLGINAVLLGDQTTGVIVIPTFDPPGGPTGIAQIYANVVEAINVLRPVAKKLILDLSRNGGGSTCLSHRILQLFFPETPESTTNFKLSDLEALLVKTGYTIAESYLRSDGTVADSTYLATKVSHPNRKGDFSNYVSDNCAEFAYGRLTVDPKAESQRPRSITKGYVYDPKAVYHPWDAEDILLFSEGICGSACATFANQMSQKNNVKTVVVAAGQSTNKVSYSTFPGGQVLKAAVYFQAYMAIKGAFHLQELPDLIKTAPSEDREEGEEEIKEGRILIQTAKTEEDIGTFQAGATFTFAQGKAAVALLPEPLVLSANLSVTWRQTYNTGNVRSLFKKDSKNQFVPNWPMNPATWTEYSFLPADYRIPFTIQGFQSYHNLWENARDAAWK
ncbi:hypothetical protein EMPS_08157 [Entomortierella parvispora]|uniref:Tail specific protease domain-containing protein n=1 Tax=Entomortierella parvispora TaxID=205924 RepID=A0A9P3HFI9_9FUNG|nr:hypothetical protein EMPS_08157 [Entomortierella parvispora]